jgi:hypothetical protein
MLTEEKIKSSKSISISPEFDIKNLVSFCHGVTAILELSHTFIWQLILL